MTCFGDIRGPPKLLPKVACHLLSICPNSATCERGFSTLGWLFERRLNLKLTTLESMSKLITYWKSNSKTELGYYGIDQRKNVRLSDDEINIRIAEALKKRTRMMMMILLPFTNLLVVKKF